MCYPANAGALQGVEELGMPNPTETTSADLGLLAEGFETLAEGLEYAAKGKTGLNFYSGRGELLQSLLYSEVQDRAIDLAQKLIRAGLPKGGRLALIAETRSDFQVFFFACQYAGMIPVPLPVPMNLGGHEAYVQRLRLMIESADACAATASSDLSDFLKEATAGLPLMMVGSHQEYYDLPGDGAELRPFGKDDLCYIQYSSGSTRFPQGVVISQKSITSNARAIINHGLKVQPGDRCVSWLPLYHDMGLVGFCLTPVLGQLSVDYIGATDFARRPLLWLKLLSENGGTLSFSPTFGYDMCVRRAGSFGDTFDLDKWRVAGLGGEMIRADILERFAETFAGSGFRSNAFLPSYGLAESTLAATFAEIDDEIAVDRVDKEQFSVSHVAVTPKGNGSSADKDIRSFVICGKPLDGHAIEIRDDDGAVLADRQVGKVYIQGPSLMTGYFNNEDATRHILCDDGWLDTGDLGYMVDGGLVISGRSKDLIICNGRNIWPQDIEWAVEHQPGLRRGDAVAFSVTGSDGEEEVVVIVQCRAKDTEIRAELEREVRSIVSRTAGVDCKVVLAPTRSLPLTSSGKLSRTWAKEKYLAGDYSDPAAGRGAQSVKHETAPAPRLNVAE